MRAQRQTGPMEHVYVVLLVLGLSILISLQSIPGVEASKLKVGFYSHSCPCMESLVTDVVLKELKQNIRLAPGIIRILFHDCFVRGCDASVLIDGPNSEKDAGNNLSLQGFQPIYDAKTAVEKVCPGVVSCADILALAAQVSVKYASGGKINYRVPLGRRDGSVSSPTEPLTQLPGPNDSVAELTASFKSKGLSQTQMVLLSGAHSIGVAHCATFASRLSPVASDLAPSFASSLKKQCPLGVASPTAVDLDLKTPNLLDSQYYKNLQVEKGLMASDENLWFDAKTRRLVSRFTSDEKWGPQFATAMLAMSRVGVLTGKHGNIRLNCAKFNK